MKPYFLDTNILIYAFEPTQSKKQEIAHSLIEDEKPWCISWQVVQEFCSVALHRFKTPPSERQLSRLLELLLEPHCRVYPTASIWRNALSIQQGTQYRFYDSLVVASALESGSHYLYSEDLQHERKIGTLEIRNPFL